MNTVRFFSSGWGRKAECAICAVDVRKNRMRVHARWHVCRGEGHAKDTPGTVKGYCDITVHDDHFESSGWVTEGTGIL